MVLSSLICPSERMKGFMDISKSLTLSYTWIGLKDLGRNSSAMYALIPLNSPKATPLFYPTFSYLLIGQCLAAVLGNFLNQI